ncbi:FixH family protein [Chitinophaga sp.]|uniref:FixH family protein n=1 Tax=Chitinophaga sp. TaxID=1869181 RepID=UPI0031D879ED
MNWGHSIIVVFVLFAAGILTLVTKSMHAHVEMVNNDYYAEELKYQQVIDGRKEAALLSAPVRIDQAGDQIAITFPPEMQGTPLSGKIYFYKAADSRQDVTVPLRSGVEGTVSISKQKLSKGQYQVQMEWDANGKHYFQEENISVN